MTKTIIAAMTVNTHDAEFEYDNFPPHREVQASIDWATLQHPSWTSIVLVITNEERSS